MPVLACAQVAPLSVDLNTVALLAPFVPIKIFDPLTAMVLMIFCMPSPELAAVQLVPLLEDTNTPPLPVPARMVVPLTPSERIFVLVDRPELTAVQLVPLLV